MTEKEIKKLNRQDLLVLLTEQTARANQLEEKLLDAEARLKERNLVVESCGTMAEASLKLNDVFKAVDDAAAQYLENVKQLCEKQEEQSKQLEAESRQKAEQLEAESRQKAEQLEAESRQKAEQLEAESKQKAEQIIREAEEFAAQENERAEKMIKEAEETAAAELAKIDIKWEEIQTRIRSMEDEYSWLKFIINGVNGAR